MERDVDIAERLGVKADETVATAELVRRLQVFRDGVIERRRDGWDLDGPIVDLNMRMTPTARPMGGTAAPIGWIPKPLEMTVELGRALNAIACAVTLVDTLAELIHHISYLDTIGFPAMRWEAPGCTACLHATRICAIDTDDILHEHGDGKTQGITVRPDWEQTAYHEWRDSLIALLARHPSIDLQPHAVPYHHAGYSVWLPVGADTRLTPDERSIFTFTPARALWDASGHHGGIRLTPAGIEPISLLQILIHHSLHSNPWLDTLAWEYPALPDLRWL